MARRGVFKPPYAAARAFLEWAVDLWPYVNGKAIMSGLRLAEMEASDMCDVLHYFMEEDLSASTAEQAEAKSEARSVIYRTLYGKTYKYAMNKSSSSGSSSYTADGSSLPDGGFYGDLDVEPFDPTRNVQKPYVPPTELNEDSYLPFGKTLDAPLN
jgi:hypothetical protein